jgi:hypothetical protein
MPWQWVIQTDMLICWKDKQTTMKTKSHLKRQITTTDKNQLTYNGLKTSKKCGQDMTMGDPNWHADMLKSQANNKGDKLSFKKTTWTITSKKCSHDMTIGDPNWHADMLKSQVTMTDKLFFKKTTLTITSKKCGQDMTMGDPNWHADMLKSPAGNLEQPSSAMQKQSSSPPWVNTFEGGTNLKNKEIWLYFSVL